MKKITCIILTVLLTFSVISVCAEGEITFYISPYGSDYNDGTYDKPFHTLYRARQSVRWQKERGAVSAGGFNIVLKSGRYFLDSALYLDSKDSGINFTGEDGAVITGAVSFDKNQFRDLSEDDTNYSRIKSDLRDKIKWVSLESLNRLDEPKEVNEMHSEMSDYIVSKDNIRLKSARYPNDTMLRVDNVYKSGSQNDTEFIIGYTDENISSWLKPDEVYLEGFGDVLWKYQKIRIGSIDTANKKITSGGTKLYSGIQVDAYIWFSNVLEELDSEDEQYIDRTQKRLYFYSDENTENISISVSKQPFLKIFNTKNISFSNINFENTRSSAVIINGGSEISFDNCTFYNIGGTALNIRKSYKCGIKNSNIASIGSGGIRFSDCGKKYNLRKSYNFVTNNEICDFSWNVPTYSPAVWVDGIGDTISHNTIHESFHAGIIFYGNDNEISYNEIYNVLTETEDAGAIYTYGDGSSRGNVIENNFIHHLGNGKKGFLNTGLFGVYFDNFNGGQIVRNNVFYDMPCAIHINSGGDNTIENNVFSEVDIPIFAHSYNSHPSTDMWNGYLKLYKDETVWLARYPELADIPDPTEPIKTYRGNVIKNNIFSLSGSIGTNYVELTGSTLINNTQTDDEIFADKDNFDFSFLLSFSNFNPIDISSCGIIQ